MSTTIVTLKAEDSIKHAAKVMIDHHIGGAPVIDDEGRLIGLITESDLITQDVKIHFPSYIHLLDSFIFIESRRRFEETLKRAAAAKVGDLMTIDVATVNPETPIEDVATLMMEKHIGRVPVIENDHVVGIVTKGDIVRTISR